MKKKQTSTICARTLSALARKYGVSDVISLIKELVTIITVF